MTRRGFIGAWLALAVLLSGAFAGEAHAENAPAPGTCFAPTHSILTQATTQVCTSPKGYVYVRIITVVHGADGSVTIIDDSPPCIVGCSKIFNFKGSCDDPAATPATCTGAPVNCPPGLEEFTYQEVIPNDVLLYNRRYCGHPGTPDILTQLKATFHPAPAQGSLQPTAPDPLPVNLELFVKANVPPQPGGTIGNAVNGGTIRFTQPRFTWDFGDSGSAGNVQTTTDPRGYPDGTVTHRYKHAKQYTVTLTVEWHVFYDETIGGNTVANIDAGYIPQPGPPQTFTANVVNAHAVLVH